MPKIVKAHTAQSVFLQKFRKSTGKILRSHTLAHFVHEHKAVVLVVVTVAADFLVQLLRLLDLHKVITEATDKRQGAYHNVKVGNVTFDFACEKKQAVYAYYDTTPGGKLTQKLWNEIENSTTKKRPFYENEYVICTVNRVPDSFWTLSKRYDNVHIVSQKMLFATYKKEYNKIAHPRFVPSFVK
jgi:hypothetical protein